MARGRRQLPPTWPCGGTASPPWGRGTAAARAGEPVRRALAAGFEATVLGPAPEVTWRTFGEYMRAVEESRPALNVGCLVPHGVVRTCVLARERRGPEAAELEAMRERVAE